MAVFQRFEIVSAPVEERLADSLASQATLIFERLSSHRDKIRTVTNDTRAIKHMAKSAVSLAMPGSLPFSFFVAAVLLRVLYVVLVGVRARRMLKRAGHLKSKGE